jgi:hypothetical protein
LGACGRVQLAPLFPGASPGNLGRGSLQDLPSRAAAGRAAEERRRSSARASTSQASWAGQQRASPPTTPQKQASLAAFLSPRKAAAPAMPQLPALAPTDNPSTIDLTSIWPEQWPARYLSLLSYVLPCWPRLA